MIISKQSSLLKTLFLIVVLAVFQNDKTFAITVNDFLLTAYHDNVLNIQQEKKNYTNDKPNIPFFDSIEFRTETDRFALDNQKYSIRFFPRGLGERKSIDNVFNITSLYEKTGYNFQFNQVIRARYNIIIELLCLEKVLNLNKRLSSLYADRMNVLKQNILNLEFDINDLLKAENDHNKIKLELIRLEKQKEFLLNKINRYLPDNAKIDLNGYNLISIDLIDKNIKSISNSLKDEDNIYLKTPLLKLKLSNAKYDLEKAKNNKYIEFFKIMYDNEHKDEMKEAIFMEIGITFPCISADQLEIHNSKIDYLNEKLKFKQLKQTLSDELEKLRVSIKQIIDQCKLMENKYKEESKNFYFKTYMETDGIDPLNLLKIKENSLKQNLMFEELYSTLLVNYIQFLDLSGKLIETPLKNYISEQQEIIIESKNKTASNSSSS